MLTLTLDNPSATYSQGEPVTGNVTFDSPAPVPVTIHICITGHTRTTIYNASSTSDAESTTGLFRTHVASIQGAQINASFEFQFPVRASPLDSSQVSPESMRLWTKQIMGIRSNHLLPPSFEHRNPEFEACVEYTLKAEVWTHAGPSQRQRRIAEKVLPITFRPRHDPDNQISAVKGDVHRITTRRQTKDQSSRLGRFLRPRRSKPDPSPDFQLQLTVPARIHPGEEIPCSVSIITGSNSPKALSSLERTPFIIRGFSISVKRKTKVWATTPGAEHDHIQNESAMLVEECTDELNAMISPGAGYKKDLLSPALEATAPSFETYNIRRVYVMVVSVKVLCGEEVREVCSENELVVLPALSESGPLSECVGSIGERDGLPSYAEAASNIVQAVAGIVG